MRKSKKILAVLVAASTVMAAVCACSSGSSSSGGSSGGSGSPAAGGDEAAVDLNAASLDEIIEKAKEEGRVESVGMPDSWANWGLPGRD